jgi:hypothetical protein
MTNIEYVAEKNEYEVIVKVFTDDFQKNIKALYNVDLNLGTPNEAKNIQEIIMNYFNKSLIISFNNEKQKLHYVSKKMNFEATWVVFKLLNKEKVNKINIENNIMNDFYRDQTNLLIFTRGSFQKAFNLDYNDIKAEINIED